MNNYKENIKQEKDLIDEIDTINIQLKNIFFRDALYKLSNFEISEQKRIELIKEEIINRINLNSDSNYLEVDHGYVKDINKHAFEKESYNELVDIKDQIVNENNALNFSMKSLLLQKQNFLKNLDISNAVKISDEIDKVKEKMNDQKDRVKEINQKIIDIEIEFYEDYQNLLNDIIKNNIAIEKSANQPKNYKTNIVDYFKLNKFLYFIENNRFNISAENLVKLLNDDKFYKEFFGEIFNDVIDGIMYVGADIQSSDK